MNSYQKEAAVGLFVVLGIAAFVGGGMFLSNKSMKSPDVVVMFTDIGNLKDGAPIRISGAPVGRVEGIKFEGVGKVRVGLVLTEEIPVKQDARASIGSVGMLGDMIVNFDPGKGEPLPKGSVITGTVESGIFDKGAVLVDQASQTMTSLNRMLDTGLVVDLRHTLATTDKLLRYLADQQGGPTAEVNATMRSLQATSARLDTTLTHLDARALQARVDSTMRSTGQLADQLGVTSARMDSLLARVLRGEGTLGKLSADSGLYVDLRRTIQATNRLIDELTKNPGKVGITVKLF
jgi:phospholipid/cholesterol/gamma-HCH transport system substrate-binding protein